MMWPFRRRQVATIDGIPTGDFKRILADSQAQGVAPHCDSAVLHAPGECVYCDGYPEWQRYRQVAGIAFTGHPFKDGEISCPSELRRPIDDINRWPGNVARPAE
jgi:hypothetical protein